MIKLNIACLNPNGHKEEFVLDLDKEKLKKCSKYFESLFTNKFADSEKESLDFDFTTNEFPCEVKYIKDLFDYALDYKDDSECTAKREEEQNITLIMDTNLGDSEIQHIYECNIEFMLLKTIPIWNYYMIIPYYEYFMFDNLRDTFFEPYDFYFKLIECLLPKEMAKKISKNTFSTEDYAFSDDEYEEEYVTKKIKKKIVTTERDYIPPTAYLKDHLKVTFNMIRSIRADDIKTDRNNLRLIRIVNDFFKNILDIYLSYKISGKEEQFKSLITLIKKNIKHIEDIKMRLILESSKPEIKITQDFLRKIPLECVYELFELLELNNGPEDQFKLYDYHHILQYEKTSFETYNIKDQDENSENPENPENLVKLMKNSVRPYPDFMELFKKETNNIFDSFDWSQVILSGGFLFGLLNNINESILDSTDIDLFILDKKEDTTQSKVEYITEFFKKYNPYYVENNSVVNIIIPNLKYDIQLIVCDKENPFDIIYDFDFTYLCMFFNGQDIYCTLAAMTSIKYQISFINSKKSVNPLRLYKTVKKGLRIVRNAGYPIKNDSVEILSQEKQNTQKTEKSKNFVALNKSALTRKLFINNFNEEEICHLIKLFYKSERVTHEENPNLKISPSSFHKYLFRQKNLDFDHIHFVKNDIGIKQPHGPNIHTYSILDKYNNKHNELYFELARPVYRFLNDSILMVNIDIITKEKLLKLKNTLAIFISQIKNAYMQNTFSTKKVPINEFLKYYAFIDEDKYVEKKMIIYTKNR